jgi:dihydrofolate reductase
MMGSLTINTFLTLDGVMQAPGAPTEDPSGGFGHGGWLVPYADADMAQYITEAFATIDAVLLGRKTYEIFAAHWPRVTDPGDPIAAALNKMPKYVVSRTLDKVEWHNSSLIQGDVVNEVAKLKRRHEREISVQGSSQLAQTLIENDLIDEYRLWFYPVVLGTGKRLFGPGTAPAALTLTGTKTTSTGVVISTYRRAGRPRYGSFGLEAESV